MLTNPVSILLAMITALFAGITKAGMPGLGITLPPLMAFSVPGRDSIGLMMMLMIVGDIFAIAYYRHHANFKLLKRLLPCAAMGIMLGALLLARLDNESIRPVLGILVSILLGIEMIRRRSNLERFCDHPILAGLTGLLAGFCSTIGNVAGPILAMYLMMLRLPKHEFMGITAWFFFIVNLTKMPIYISLDVIRIETFQTALWLAIFVGVGAFVGIRLFRVLSQQYFDGMILFFTALTAILLIVG